MTSEAMEWLLLLMLSVASVTEGAVNEDAQKLAERIVETEGECDSLQSLARKSTIYSTLMTICEDSLNEDKYAYVKLSKINLEKYKDKNKIPVKIGHKEEWVKIPPQLTKEKKKEMLKGFNEKKKILANKFNKRGQKIVYQQIKCELTEDESCFRKLNCMKYKLIDDTHLDLKLQKDYFPIVYKGKRTDINSPPEADDVAALCADFNDEEDNEDFGELDALMIQPLKFKVGGTKMVTKSLTGGSLKGQLGKAALAAATNGALGKDISKPNVVGNLISLLAPNLGGFMASSMISGNKKSSSPFALVGKEHINTLMIFITNKLKRKKDRVPLRRNQVRVAVEVVTKTFLHFLILSVRLKKGLTSNVVPKKRNGVVETIKMTLVDAVAANVVNFVVNLLMPEDDGIGQSGGEFIDTTVASTPAKQVPPPPPPPLKEYSSREAFDDDDDDDDEEE